MLTVKKFNNISDIIYKHLDKERYSFLEDGQDGSYQLALVRSAELTDLALPEELIAVARAGAGYNNIPVDKCSEAGIVVFNTPGANANAVKELVIAGMLLSGRKIIKGSEWIASQKEAGASGVDKTMEKAKKNFVGREIAGKKLGVVGLGAVGVMVANAATGMDMEVMGYDPFLTVGSALRLKRNVTITGDLKQLFRQCDFITLHLPMNADTKGMVNKDLLSLMKPDAVLLNFARGGLIVDEDVMAALDSHRLGTYVTDFPDDRIITSDKVIAFPHLGASTPEAEENCARMAAEQLDDYVRFGTIRNSVNFPPMELPFDSACRLVILNRNITNMVGQITTVLAAESLNIEHMVNRSKGGWACTIIDLDRKPSGSAVKAMNDVDGVVRIRVIEK